MDRLLRNAGEMERDQLEEEGKLTPMYDCALTDVIVITWQDLEDPWKWLQSNPDLMQSFLTAFEKNKKEIQNIILYRGVNMTRFSFLQAGSIVDYASRYTSWTTKAEVSVNFTDMDSPMFFVYNGPITAFDIRKSNRKEQELIVAPSKFVIERVLRLQAVKDEEEQGRILEAALSNASTTGDGLVVILKPLLQ